MDLRLLVPLPALILAGCGFSAPAPKRTPPPKPPAPPVSSVSATFTVEMRDVLAMLNEKTKDEIAHVKNQKTECAIAKCHLDLTATRQGEISGHLADGKIYLSLPFAVKSHLDFKSKLLNSGGDASADGLAQTETALALGPDWKLESDTQGTIKLSDADLNIGPLKMHVASLWNHNEDKLTKPIFKELDRRIASAVKIRDQAKRFWLKMQRPIRVGKSPTAWLLLQPEKISISGPFTAKDSLSASISIEGRPHVVIADTEPEMKPAALPPPQHGIASSNAFAVSVPVLLPYAEAASLALKRLADHPLRVNGDKVNFDKLEILPSGEDVIVATHFCVAQSWDPFGWFDACGDVYLRGAPVFDSATDTIRVANVHYDVASENAMLAAMRALAGDELGKGLETKLVFDVSKDIAKLQNE
ncbi:MAG TPA: DUF4403 family protein, partial [Rhizomicrobium sp.]|nr:DUF4403 family protein [Rhizomicrobium sp.]